MQKELKRNRPLVVCTAGWTALLVDYDYPPCWPPAANATNAPYVAEGVWGHDDEPFPSPPIHSPFPLFLLSLPVEVGPHCCYGSGGVLRLPSLDSPS